MYYTIYETINLINNKVYIGYHSTKNLKDNYLGSGKVLKLAIKKYGVGNFSKRVLYVFPTKSEALEKEREIVNEEFIRLDNNYNLKYGGEGGWEHTWHDSKRKEAYLKAIKEGRAKGWSMSSEKRSEIGRRSFLRRTHTKEAKEKIGKAHLLNPDVWAQRLKDYNKIDKKYGWRNKLAKQWQVSHTQVNRILPQLDVKI